MSQVGEHYWHTGGFTVLDFSWCNSLNVTLFPLKTVVGTDIADLLLKEHRSVWLPGKSPNEANLIDFNNEPLARAEEEPGAGPLSLLSDTFMTVPENVGKETERFRELLLFGRKKVRTHSLFDFVCLLHLKRASFFSTS